MEEFIRDNKKNIMIVIILIIVLILFLIISNMFKSHKYVYTIEEKNNSKLPYIQLNSKEIETINNQLKFDFDIITSYNNDSYITYDTSKNGDILSVVIEKNIRINETDFLETEYKTYNISLKTKKIYSNDYIIKKFNLNKKGIYNLIYNELKKQYNEELRKGYMMQQQCGFLCFIESKNFVSVDDNVQLFVKENKVYAYLNIRNSSIFYLYNDYPVTKKIYKLN